MMCSVDMELKYKDQPQYYFDSLVAQASSNLKLDILDQLQAWQDSFRSLYYMLRKKMCDLFYVCTSQFVVTFVGSKKVKRTCDAHISQSTRSLRSLLKENDVIFSMPFVDCEGCEGDVDNSPKSRLLFSGNNSVHGLYDFLLNLRFTMPSFIVVDVPLLYSAVAFEKSVLYSSRVTCEDETQADHRLDSISESWDTPLATHFSPINFTDDSELASEATGSEKEYDDDEPGFYYDDCVPKSW